MSLPQIIELNAYNVVGLPGASPLPEVKKRAAHLISLAKIDESEEFTTDLGTVKAKRTEQELKKALERLTSVKDRLAEVFFWFEVSTVADSNALALITNGAYKDAAHLWNLSAVSVDWLAKKNRALALFLDSFVNRDLNSFSSCIDIWREIFYSNNFWSFYKAHYQATDDLGTDPGLIDDFRSTLPDRLSRFTNETFHRLQEPVVLGLYYSLFSTLGQELEQNVLAPRLREINSSADRILDLSSAKSFPGVAAVESLAEDLRKHFASLALFNIDSHSPVQVMRARSADKLRSASVAFHNQHNQLGLSKMLLELSGSICSSESHQAVVKRDQDQLKKNEETGTFIDALVAKLEGAAPENAYVAWLELDKSSPESLRTEENYRNVKRKIIAEYVIECFNTGKKQLGQRDEVRAEATFRLAFEVIKKHLDEYALNKEKALEIVDGFTKEVRAISDPDNLAIADRRIAEAREIAKKSNLDEWSQVAFVLICQLAIHREISPYMRRLRYGSYLVRIGWFTIYIYGIGVIFLLAGFLYKRKKF